MDVSCYNGAIVWMCPVTRVQSCGSVLLQGCSNVGGVLLQGCSNVDGVLLQGCSNVDVSCHKGAVMWVCPVTRVQ